MLVHQPTRVACAIVATCVLCLAVTAHAGTFTVASFDSSGFNTNNRGQSFTPSIPGDGNGSSGSLPTVYLQSVALHFEGDVGPDVLYLYEDLPTLADLDAGVGFLAQSSSHVGGTYLFNDVPLTRTEDYWALYSGEYQAWYQPSESYSGGYRAYISSSSGALTYSSGAITSDLEFEATLNAVPEPATMALLSLAACGLGGYVRRRRKA